MLATSVEVEVVRAFWGLSKKDMKAELRDVLKEVLPPCYQEDGKVAGSASKVRFSVDTSPAAKAFGEPQSMESYEFSSAPRDANAGISEPGAHLPSFDSPAQMASTAGKQAPTIGIEIHDFDINIDYPDFDFRGQCVS